MNRRLLLLPFFLSIILAGGLPVRAESGVAYDIGAPILTDLYVSPLMSHMTTYLAHYNTVLSKKQDSMAWSW
jgi:hypothetical protein